MCFRRTFPPKRSRPVRRATTRVPQAIKDHYRHIPTPPQPISFVKDIATSSTDNDDVSASRSHATSDEQDIWLESVLRLHGDVASTPDRKSLDKDHCQKVSPKPTTDNCDVEHPGKSIQSRANVATSDEQDIWLQSVLRLHGDVSTPPKRVALSHRTDHSKPEVGGSDSGNIKLEPLPANVSVVSSANSVNNISPTASTSMSDTLGQRGTNNITPGGSDSEINSSKGLTGMKRTHSDSPLLTTGMPARRNSLDVSTSSGQLPTKRVRRSTSTCFESVSSRRSSRELFANNIVDTDTSQTSKPS